MKRITFLTLTILFFSYSLFGQITKKNWLVGGNATFSSTDYKSELVAKNTITIFQISPNIGYFFADRLAVGARVSFHSSQLKATGTSTTSKYTTSNLGPFVRYYFLKPNNQTNILLEASYQYGTEKGDSWKNKKNTFSVAAGPVIYLNTVVGIEFIVGYSSEKYVDFDGSNNTIQVGIGLQIHLEKEK